MLGKEMEEGYLTEQEYHDYIRLFKFAADRVLVKHPQLQEEVNHMTERWLKLPGEIRAELERENVKQRAEIAEKVAEILRLQEMNSQLTAEKAAP